MRAIHLYWRQQRWFIIIALVVFIDQLTKGIAELTLTLHQPIAVLPLVNFTLVYNEGAAFSFLSQAGGWQRWLFIALALGVMIILTVWLKRLAPDQRLTAWGLVLLISGAFGNVFDRIVRGAVVDFIDVYYQTWHWPAFNIADSAISIGVAVLLFDTLRSGQR